MDIGEVDCENGRWMEVTDDCVQWRDYFSVRASLMKTFVKQISFARHLSSLHCGYGIVEYPTDELCTNQKRWITVKTNLCI